MLPLLPLLLLLLLRVIWPDFNMRKLYLIWLHILSLQFAFTTCCTDLYLQQGAKSREPRAMGHEPFPFPLIPSLQAFGILC